MSQLSADEAVLVVQALDAIGRNDISQSVAASPHDVRVLRPALYALLNEADVELQDTARGYFGMLAASTAKGPYLPNRVDQMCKALEAVGRPDLSRSMTATASRDFLLEACAALLGDEACREQLAARACLRNIPGVAL
jgi:hypothetical protein